MALVVRRIAPSLLASVTGALLIVPLAARAETPTTPAAGDCLAKPNGPSAKGSHWYYRVEHPSGRHCWYQRPLDAAQDAPKEAPAHARMAAAAAAPPAPPVAPAASPPSDTAAPALMADNGGSVVPPVDAPAAPIAAPTAAPYGTFGPGVVPSAPPAAAPNPAVPSVYNVAQAPADSAAQPPADPPAATPPSPQPPPDVVAPKLAPKPAPLPTRSVNVAPHDEYADPPSHVPALFGAVSALVIIILGSFVGRFLGERRERRAQAAARARDRRRPVSSVPESPDLVPVMAAAGAAAQETEAPWPDHMTTPDDWGLRRPRRPRRAETPAAPIREATRVLEDNVRELLGRLQNELRGGEGRPLRAAAVSRTASGPADAQVPTARELDAVLAIWRAKREARSS